MCGLVAVWDRSTSTDVVSLEETCARMRDTLVHRGPDDAGTWADAKAGLALGHRRLSIVDLSAAGHQPMASPSERWICVFNGEIYNAEELRAELPGVSWRGSSDTEVLCAAVDRWGFVSALQRLRGMFAIVAFDRGARTLWMARDRLGQKPLYWHRGARFTLVGSELRALRVHPSCPTSFDREAFADVLRWKAVQAPRTALQGVHQVVPGGWVRLGADGAVRQGRYWTVGEAAAAVDMPRREADAADALEALIRESVALRLRADVPLGTLLSGGIDSALVTSLLVDGGGRIRTYTVSTDDPAHDESRAAAAVARHLETEHTTLVLRSTDLLDRVRSLVSLQDEPFGDSSLVPTAAVSALARQHVTVALAGDGGDELFGGYRRYHRSMRAWSAIGRVPRRVRQGMASALAPLREWSDGSGGDTMAGWLRHGARRVDQLGSPTLDALYEKVLGAVADPRDYLHGVGSPAVLRLPGVEGHAVRRLMRHDLLNFLPNDILVKTDRASMAASLELRAPLLDHHVVAFASAMPAEWTWAGGLGKKVLRRVLGRYLPESLWERPKQGFSVPFGDWLRGPLRPWAEALLTPAALVEHGVWRVEAVRALWDGHQRGADHRALLWSVLQIQAWVAHRPEVPSGRLSGVTR